MTVRLMAYSIVHQQNSDGARKFQEPANHACHDPMCITHYQGDPHRIVEVSDEVVKQMKDAVLKGVRDGYGWNDTDYTNSIIRNYAQTATPKDCLPASWTLQQIRHTEVDRLGQYIHAQDPKWTLWGQKFDLSILDNYRQGIDVRA